MNITDEEIHTVVSTSALHDIGKIAIPDHILLKPGCLTLEEFEIMKKHTIYGIDMLEKFNDISDKDFIRFAQEICLHHHERIDGKGYPDHLKDAEIPIYVQIVSIADVYDALISPRVYKTAYSTEEAMNMILNGACGAFSPEIKELFLNSESELKALYL